MSKRIEKCTISFLSTIIIAFVLLLALGVSEAYASEEVSSGTCGEGISWVLDSDGLLTITGTGEMPDYSEADETSQSPFCELNSQIKSVVVEDGITYIGEYTFSQCNNIEDITIPFSVDSIGDSAFDGCESLSNVYYDGTEDQWNSIAFGQNNTFLTDAQMISTHEHVYDSEVITEPTCTEPGYTTHTCTQCGGSYTDNNVEPLGHDYVVSKVVDPTTTEKGYTIYECSRCGDKYNDDYVDTLPFDKSEVILNLYRDEYEDVEVYVKLKSVTSKDTSIANCHYYSDEWYDESHISIEPTGQKLGSTEIIATAEDGAVYTIKVTVKCSFVLNYSSTTIKHSYKSYYNLYDRYSDTYGTPLYVIYGRSPIDDSGNIVLGEEWFEEGSPYYQVFFSEAAYENYYDNYHESDGTVYISKAISKNTSVVKLRTSSHNNYIWEIIPASAGTATIECTDSFGQKAYLKVTVPKTFMDSYLKGKTKPDTLRYGSHYATGYTAKGAKVTVLVGGKKYTAKANSKGRYAVKIPVKKIGTTVKIGVSYGGGKYTFSKKIAKPGSSVAVSRVYRSSRKATVAVKKLHQGDRVIVKIGNDTYTKSIRKDVKKLSYTVAFKRTYSEGSVVSVTIKNKYKQNVAAKNSKVYYASTIRQGITKNQCKLVPGWEHPSEVYVSGSWETWWYNYKRYVDFYDGLVYGWHYF